MRNKRRSAVHLKKISIKIRSSKHCKRNKVIDKSERIETPPMFDELVTGLDLD